MLYECDKCKSRFPDYAAESGCDIVNRDPVMVERFAICPDCGHDILNEVYDHDD